MANSQNSVKYDSNGFALACPSCGAPSNGMKHCQWCGSAIPYIKIEGSHETTFNNNNTTLDNIAKGISNAVYTITGIKL